VDLQKTGTQAMVSILRGSAVSWLLLSFKGSKIQGIIHYFAADLILHYRVHHLQNFSECVVMSIRQAHAHLNLLPSCPTRVPPSFNDG